MAMDSAQHQRIIDAIKRKIGDRELVCPISGHTDAWGVDTSSAALPAVDRPGTFVPPGGPVFPVAVIICEECGYTFLMNLVRLGVADESGIEAHLNV